MNDLELIRHWHLREEFELTLCVLLASIALAVAFAALACYCAGPWAVIALVDVGLATALIWRLVTLARRLRALEDLIP